ncbi:EID1-like F-box protein 3 [Silene latifolia]|uniref:EID1-like F-box protein 3 n=1 Tax=Silene latifolia TaxID=37657 RepID=UPI003D76E0CF
MPPYQMNDNNTTKRSKSSLLCEKSDSGFMPEPESGIVNEKILLLVFEFIKWDLPTLCTIGQVCRKLRAVSQRVLWRELCINRAPTIIGALMHGSHNSQFGGGWHSLGKLLFYCCGCQPTPNIQIQDPKPGHIVKAVRFSKTSGQSFLIKSCREDLLYVNDPCEHAIKGGEDDLGLFRGVFRGFFRSKTRACLINRQVKLEERVRCPYCGARVWSMASAKMVPKSAVVRLGSHKDGLDYFVCINGHLYGACWLVRLSSDGDDDPHDDHDFGQGSARYSTRTS